jgi:hypothetical protein
MLELPSTLPELETMDPEDRMFVHTERPKWGVGLWVREERTRRRVRFEDGEMRAFKKGFYHLLKPVDAERDDLDDIFDALADEHEQVQAEKAALKARKDKPPVMSFDEQMMVFRALYPDGFADETFIDASRGKPEDDRYAKRHVVEELAMAKELLSKATMQAHIAQEDYQAILDGAVQILSRTTLVKPSKGRKLLEKVSGDQHAKTFALALYALLHGQKRFRKRFGAWVDALTDVLGEEPNWGIATIFPALLYPTEHVCVKRRPFALEAREVKPGTHISKAVNRRSYRRARRVARKVRKLLTDQGMEPRDMLDVRRFVWDTLRPKGKKMLDEMKS